jgi:hypothetical protein
LQVRPEINPAENLYLIYTFKSKHAITGDHMIKNPRNRRVIAVIMVGSGAALMILTPETWPGALLLILGIALELVGISLERKPK